MDRRDFMKVTGGGALAFATAGVEVGCNLPPWVNEVENIAVTAAGIAAEVISVLDPPLAPLVTTAENIFNAIKNTLDTYKKNPTPTNLSALENLLASLQANETALESALGSSPALDNTINTILDELNQAVIEISADIPPSAPVSVKKMASAKYRVKNWKSTDFKREFNDVIKGDSRFHKL